MINQWERNVIPKWRRSVIAATLPETHALTKVKKISYKADNEIDYLTKELIVWRESKSIGVAADLLNHCYTPELTDILVEPANYILQSKENVPNSLLLLAKRITGEAPNITESHPYIISNPDELFVEIAKLKGRLSYNPRDAITLVDIARLYASLGQKEKANRAISIATSIYPNHRFILRSSIRHWIHAGELEKGLFLLRNTERTKSDPWLLASELAIESVMKKSPKRWKLAKEIISSNRFSPTHVTELASASAAIHLADGNFKDSKRMFNKSLVAPNDNAIAQAVWASEYFGIHINTRPEWFEGKFSAEANYYKKQSELDFNGAIEAATDWFHSEPFSLRPIRAATYASAIMDKYGDSESFAKLGLKIDNTDTELRNNLVYALACQEKLEEAYKELQRVLVDERNIIGKIGYHSFANLALLNYRYGHFEEAERLYRECISMTENSESKALATTTMAKEALLANAPNSSQLIEEARKIVLNTKSAGAIKMLERLGQTDVQKTKKKTENQDIKWLHDKATNTLLITKNQPFKVKD